jgi:hypothetical protein
MASSLRGLRSNSKLEEKYGGWEVLRCCKCNPAHPTFEVFFDQALEARSAECSKFSGARYAPKLLLEVPVQGTDDYIFIIILP